MWPSERRVTQPERMREMFNLFVSLAFHSSNKNECNFKLIVNKQMYTKERGEMFILFEDKPLITTPHYVCNSHVRNIYQSLSLKSITKSLSTDPSWGNFIWAKIHQERITVTSCTCTFWIWNNNGYYDLCKCSDKYTWETTFHPPT